MGRLKIQWCCTERERVHCMCAKIRAPRRRAEANETMKDRGDCQQRVKRGLSGKGFYSHRGK